MSDVSNRNGNDSNPAPSRRILPWVLILVVAAAIAGSYLWKNNRGDSAFSEGIAVQTKAEPPAPQDDTKQAVAALQQAALQQTAKDIQSANQHAADQISDLQRQLSAEHGERKSLSEQLGALRARVDSLANSQARASIAQPAKKKNGR